MISIIICSVNNGSLNRLIQNIEETIGITHEIIAFDNKNTRRGISEVYNLCSVKAGYPYVCFMHEDILFETPDWGKKVCMHFADPQIGLIGVAGGDTKSLVPSSWPSSIYESEISIIQHFRDNPTLPVRITKTGYPEDPGCLKKVCCIDGVWMCTRKEILEEYQFDAVTCPLFHGYDIDFSLQVQSGFQVAVAFDIMLRHFSEGSFGRGWLLNAIHISDKWKNKLPCSVRDLSHSDYVRQHWTSMNIFIDKMAELGFKRVFMFRQLFKYCFNRFFHFRHFLHSIRKIIFKI